MKVQERMKRSRAHALPGAMITTVCVSLATPAIGQGPGQGQGQSCVQERLDCSSGGLDGGVCSSFQSCFVTATESLYYSVDGRRFDCDGLDCARAQEELNAYCCPRVDADAGAGAVRYSDGCALGHSAASTGSFVLLGLFVLAGLRRRHRS
jgi:MYXO-CTERM domain-containing protein